MKFRPPEYGVELVEGVPGSGKSLYLVRRMIQVLIEQRRPVYTNLPLVWRSCRWYLRKQGGEKLAGMLCELKKEHFMRFAARQALKAEFLEKVMTFRGQRINADRKQAMWEDAHGKDVTEGPGANWILAGAVVIIDEAHHWFPQKGPGQEDPNVVSYVTKHRHHFHWVWLATQNRMQVSVSFRRNLSKMWEVRNMGEDKVAWGIRFKHLGVRAIGYAAYTGDQVEAKVSDVKTPIANYVFFPTMPGNQFWFRLYRSFTHVASPAQMRRQMERARMAVGLTADGREDQLRKTTHGFVARILRLCLWAGGAFSSAAIFGGTGYALARWNAPKEVAAAKVEKEKPIQWGSLKSISRDSVRVDGQKITVGGNLKNGASLEYVSMRPRACVLQLAGDVWVWKFGEASPQRLGPTPEVFNVVHARRLGTAGGREQGPAAPRTEGMGPAQGDGFDGR